MEANQSTAIKGNILIVDDTLPNLHLLSTLLTEHGYTVQSVSNGMMALTVVDSAPPDLILLDIGMPGLNGYEVCERLKANEKTQDIPVIFISALYETIDKVKAFAVGGVDYITKPFQMQEVLARIENHLTLCNLRRELQAANDTLEKRVEERTTELARTIVVLEEQITERQQAQNERIKLEKQLHQAQKMEALGQLAGGIAHDFNNLLTVIIGYSDLLLAHKLANNDAIRGEIEQISLAGKQAAILTNQLLAFSRQQILQPQVLDLNNVVQNLEKMLRRLINKNIDLMTMLEPGPKRVKTDAGQLEQMIINLVINARDAMPHGGQLTIEVTSIDLNENLDENSVDCQLDTKSAKADSYVVLAVSDTGIGMDADTQARIFEPFFTTKVKGKGTGLGLATVHGIVSQSGGRLQVTSALHQGTTFTVYLPQVEAEVEMIKPLKMVSNALNGSETILLVEDEEPVRHMMGKLLQWQGYTVLEAGSSDEALLVCERHTGPLHLLIVDVVIPQISGPELAEWLTLLRPEMKILFISAYASDNIIHHGILDSDVAFLQKPFSQNELASKVREVLDHTSVSDWSSP